VAISKARSGGLIAYLVTPLSADGRKLRTELFKEYIERLLEWPEIDGIACLANDFAYFSDTERQQIARAVTNVVRGLVPLFVCTSAISTEQTIAFSKHAQDCGAASVVINPQNYLPLTDDDVLRHFEAVAKAISVPIHVYNNPSTTNRDMSVALLRRIVNATGSSSIKEAGGLTKIQQLRLEFGDSVSIHVGFHFMALGGFALGATGWDAGLVPSLAPACGRLYALAVSEKRLQESQELFFSLLPLFEFFRRKGVIRSLKLLASMDGLDLGGTRDPIGPLETDDTMQLRAIAERALGVVYSSVGPTKNLGWEFKNGRA
jgi:4-hydroxy-tetrahydrodipicolinate synthase